MGKIYFLMGKSASGKDTVYSRLIKDESLELKPYVGYTTRPIRAGEQEGVEYHFTDTRRLDAFEEEGKLIEKRVYHTAYGDWYYYSVDTDEVNLDNYSYLYIGTLESYSGMRRYYGADRIVPIYLEIDDGLRLFRALEREMMQLNPGYKELCRRFITDDEDFSEEKLEQAGINRRFDNTDLEACLRQIKTEIFGKKNTQGE